ncbi:MAG TPA: hypothetical protein VFE60_14350 [Roseiarcus sp.]|nr:hypothetical protein [Roseiarcus sp.]
MNVYISSPVATAALSSRARTTGLSVAIGSRVKIARAELLRLFPDPERLDACIGRLRGTARIDCVTYIQRHRPAFEGYELPLKD